MQIVPRSLCPNRILSSATNPAQETQGFGDYSLETRAERPRRAEARIAGQGYAPKSPHARQARSAKRPPVRHTRKSNQNRIKTSANNVQTSLNILSVFREMLWSLFSIYRVLATTRPITRAWNLTIRFATAMHGQHTSPRLFNDGQQDTPSSCGTQRHRRARNTEASL